MRKCAICGKETENHLYCNSCHDALEVATKKLNQIKTGGKK